MKYPLNPSFPEGPAASISLHKKGFSGALFNAFVKMLVHLLPGLLRIVACNRPIQGFLSWSLGSVKMGSFIFINRFKNSVAMAIKIAVMVSRLRPD